MALRDTLNNNSAVVTIGAVATLVIALGIIVWTQKGSRGPVRNVPTEKYFYDVQAKTLYKVPIDTLSPSVAPSGGEGVEAYVMTCEDSCKGADLSGMTAEQVAEQGFFIAYLERMTENARRELEKLKAKNPNVSVGMYHMEAMINNQFRTVNSERWVSQNDMRFRQLQEQLMNKCPGKRYPTRCFPGQK